MNPNVSHRQEAKYLKNAVDPSVGYSSPERAAYGVSPAVFGDSVD